MQQQDNHEYPFLYQRRSEERFSRNAETDLVCRLLLEKKKLTSVMFTASRIQDRFDFSSLRDSDSNIEAVSLTFDPLTTTAGFFVKHQLTPFTSVMFTSSRIQDWFDFSSLFFFNATATTEIYTLSLHDALPICSQALSSGNAAAR